ncbi:YbeD family protein [Aliamphritea spongicola]|uniref:YbeD family protein n=1 Tax=Aliamphritea spongicola TaxID=707589 RepID=UPI00196A7951|nr:DUF493 family protein [Aliamphritea spongicola]MBN3563862.1 DUF493 family protein [Aliamphritea spongicola]
MSEQEAPKIEFPCADYPVKVLGRSAPDYKEFVLDVVRKYDPALDVSKVVEQPSKNGKFTAIRIKMTAASAESLAEMHKEFMASGRVQMVM